MVRYSIYMDLNKEGSANHAPSGPSKLPANIQHSPTTPVTTVPQHSCPVLSPPPPRLRLALSQSSPVSYSTNHSTNSRKQRQCHGKPIHIEYVQGSSTTDHRVSTTLTTTTSISKSKDTCPGETSTAWCRCAHGGTTRRSSEVFRIWRWVALHCDQNDGLIHSCLTGKLFRHR